MKKLLFLFLLASLILTGCAGSKDTNSSDPDVAKNVCETIKHPEGYSELDSYRAVHDTDEREIVLSYSHGSCGTECLRYESFTVVYDLYNDKTIDLYGSAEEVPDDKNCKETFTVSDSDYNKILDYIRTSGIDLRKSVKLSEGDCDRVNYYLSFFDKNGLFNKIGGYAVNDKDFGELADLISGLVKQDDQSRVLDGFKDNYKMILENEQQNTDDNT